MVSFSSSHYILLSKNVHCGLCSTNKWPQNTLYAFTFVTHPAVFYIPLRTPPPPPPPLHIPPHHPPPWKGTYIGLVCHWHHSQHGAFLSVQCLLNWCVDSLQTFKNLITRFWWAWPLFKVTALQRLFTFDQKLIVCTLSHELMDGFRSSLHKWVKSLLDFGDIDLIVKVSTRLECWPLEDIWILWKQIYTCTCS